MMLIPGVSTIKRSLVLLATAGLLVSACGSGGQESSGVPNDTETTAPVASAQENAVVSGAVCFDWPDGTVVTPCAVGQKGPGGGRVFYDAGSEQSWGRFLEVAPQNWGGAMHKCSRWTFVCGAAGDVTSETSDNMPGVLSYYPCGRERVLLLPGEAGDTLWEIGGGRRNTEVLSKTAECVGDVPNAITKVMEYRVRSGISDWYLPSGGELTVLCKYEGRSAIGGFLNTYYLSSTVGPGNGYTDFFEVDFKDAPNCPMSRSASPGQNTYEYSSSPVRPIRAFSGLLAASYPYVSVGFGESGPVLGQQN